MKQIFKAGNLINKTIKAVADSSSDNAFVLLFENETYAIFRGCAWEEGVVELVDDRYILDASERLSLGLITTEKYLTIVGKKENGIAKMWLEKRERKELERLKVKYE